MTKNELASLIGEIVQDHKFDRDGGYRLIEAITNLEQALDNNDQALLIEYLLDNVNDQDSKLWGIALEVLIRNGSEKIAKSLEGIVRSRRQDEESTEQLILALLRMGHDALDIYVPHIQSLLVREKPACAELAHLYRVSADLSLKMSASFLAGELSAEGGIRRAENCMSVFMYNYPKQDEDALSRLVDETSKIDDKAAENLRSIILDYLARPWVVQYLGPEKTKRVLAHLTKG